MCGRIAKWCRDREFLPPSWRWWPAGRSSVRWARPQQPRPTRSRSPRRSSWTRSTTSASRRLCAARPKTTPFTRAAPGEPAPSAASGMPRPTEARRSGWCSSARQAQAKSPPRAHPPLPSKALPTRRAGGDTDQALDHTGKDYFVDLWALACDRVATTIDRGATALQNAYGCNNPAQPPCDNVNPNLNNCRPDGSDRQWYTVFDPLLPSSGGFASTAPDLAKAPMIYMEYNNLVTTQNQAGYWIKSQDGLNFTPANNNLGNFGPDGYPATDQVTGKVFQAAGNGSSLVLNIGTPDANGNLCFLDDSGPTTVGTGPSAVVLNCPTPSTTGGLITVASSLLGSPTCCSPSVRWIAVGTCTSHTPLTVERLATGGSSRRLRAQRAAGRHGQPPSRSTLLPPM